MKRIYYFILGLIVSPVVILIAIHGLGENIAKAMNQGYKKGVKKWMKKQEKNH